MDRKATFLTLAAALGTMLTALATHGSDAIKALGAVPVLIEAWAAGLPLGFWSFVLALALATLAWVAAIRQLPVGAGGKAPFVSANAVALVLGPAVTVVQHALADVRTPGALVNALIVGLIAGLAAPHIGALLRGKARTAP
ncbi:hypothetical protein EIM50_13670 [Pseudoxanthomonas sp. SGD-10]|nr:hypothetical protein EIM50_13670 [Pseudoxanthomonas sp. SGD-10]